MFVSESGIFTASSMKLRICSVHGMDVVVDVSPDLTIDKLKIFAVSQFHEPSESSKTSLYHKVIHVDTNRVLAEENTINQEGVGEYDELLLLKRRTPAPILEQPGTKDKKSKNKAAPSLEVIRKATEGLVSRNHDPELHEGGISGADMSHLNSLIHFQTELRKILISLIDAAQKILCLNPEAAKVFKEAESYLEEQNSGPTVDKDALKQLQDMGFPENRATKALLLNKMSPMEAVQWLVEHDGDPDIDTPVPGMPEAKPEKTEQAGDAVATAETKVSSTDSNSQLSKISGPRNVANILESFKAFRRKQFKPNARAVKNLVEMGFLEQDVNDALRVTGNKEEDACDWLLAGNKKEAASDLEEGLDPEGPVYKAIMCNPVVQLGLNNPRSLLAFLHMLENPNATQQWLNDPDTGPMLIQISRIYHAEKHAPTPSTSSNS